MKSKISILMGVIVFLSMPGLIKSAKADNENARNKKLGRVMILHFKGWNQKKTVEESAILIDRERQKDVLLRHQIIGAGTAVGTVVFSMVRSLRLENSQEPNIRRVLVNASDDYAALVKNIESERRHLDKLLRFENEVGVNVGGDTRKVIQSAKQRMWEVRQDTLKKIATGEMKLSGKAAESLDKVKGTIRARKLNARGGAIVAGLAVATVFYHAVKRDSLIEQDKNLSGDRQLGYYKYVKSKIPQVTERQFKNLLDAEKPVIVPPKYSAVVAY